MNPVPGRTEVLHHSESGICERQINGNALSYAGQLARYISSPSTIRARVLEQFGIAPSIDDIRDLQAQRHEERGYFRDAHAGLGGEPNDRFRFRVRSLVPTERSPDARASKRRLESGLTMPSSRRSALPALPSEIVAAIAAAFGFKPEAITGRSRLGRLLPARRTAAYVLRQRGNSFTTVGRWLGGRDHSTVMNLVRGFETMATDRMREIAAQFVGGGDA